MHCVSRKLIFGKLSAAVKIQLNLPLSKWLFLIMVGKSYGPTKLDVLGTWQYSISSNASWIFFALYRGTLG